MGNSHQDRFSNPDYANQVAKTVSSVGTTSSAVHVVTSGYNFYPRSLHIAQGSGVVRVYVSDAGAVVQYDIAQVNSGAIIDLRGFAPIEAGWSIKAISTAGAAGNIVTIVGNEEVA